MSKLAKYSKQLESQGKLEEAMTYLEMDIEQKTSSYDVRMDMGRILNKQGNFEEAIKSFDLVLSMDENHAESLFGKGISLLGLNEWIASYNSFLKSIKIDTENANVWYYMAIILKDKSIFLSDKDLEKQAKDAFEEFMKYDNNQFKLERESYKFGLIFEQRKNELFGFEKEINITEFKEELESLNIKPQDIDYYLHCLPYNDLIKKITSIKEKKFETDVKNIIFTELHHLGLDDIAISKMFEVETTDSLKEKIIVLKGVNPFPASPEPLNISYYVKKGFDVYVDKYIKQGYKIIPNVSKFNILQRINVYNKKAYYNFGMEQSRFTSVLSNKNKQNSEKYFKFGMKLISNGDLRGLNYLNEALEICPNDDALKFSIKFYFATALSKYGYVKQALNYYTELNDEKRDLKKIDSFLFNFGNICYDLKYYEHAKGFYDKYLNRNPDCEGVKILRNSIIDLLSINEVD